MRVVVDEGDADARDTCADVGGYMPPPPLITPPH